MTADVERLVRRRARYRCEYCRLPQSASRGPHQIDHIIAEQHEETYVPHALEGRYKGRDSVVVSPFQGSRINVRR